jgi:hypothetical protein
LVDPRRIRAPSVHLSVSGTSYASTS